MKARKRRRVVLVAMAVIAGLLILPVVAWRLHKSRTTQLFGELVTSVPTADSVVALTFDDGPTSAYTDSVLDLLRAERVPATFFVIGSSVARAPDVTRRIVNEGHELGNHSYSHAPMVLMSRSRIRQEVESTDSLIRAAGVTGQIHFRPPYGKRLIALPWYLSRTNRTTVLWTLEPDSWFGERDAIVRHVVENVSPGAVILLHVEMPSRAAERAALPLIIRELKQQGYNFATISQLMARGTSER